MYTPQIKDSANQQNHSRIGTSAAPMFSPINISTASPRKVLYDAQRKKGKKKTLIVHNVKSQFPVRPPKKKNREMPTQACVPKKNVLK
jgi:hypothetical protein